jgi:hypothetical protein
VSVHWPGTSQDAIGDPGKAGIAQRLQHYRSYHLGKGWQDIGYNFAIDQAGRVWMLRSTRWHGNLVGAHSASDANPGANREYVGVLLLLGDREPLSPAMLRAFRDWYHTTFLPGWPHRNDVRGHGQVDGASTRCPGPYARSLMGDLVTPNPSQEDDDMTKDQFMEWYAEALHQTQLGGSVLENGAPVTQAIAIDQTHKRVDDIEYLTKAYVDAKVSEVLGLVREIREWAKGTPQQ